MTVWHPITQPPVKSGRYLVRAPSMDKKKDFFQVAWYEKMTAKEKKEAPAGYGHGFYVYPEQWVPFLTHWTPIPEFKEPKRRRKE